MHKLWKPNLPIFGYHHHLDEKSCGRQHSTNKCNAFLSSLVNICKTNTGVIKMNTSHNIIDNIKVFDETVPLYVTPTSAPLSIKAEKIMKKEIVKTTFFGGTMIAKRRANETDPHAKVQKLMTNIHHLQRLFLSHSATSEAQMA